MQINIVCLKWGNKFDAAYVNRLYYGFKRHSTVDFLFHCFTDNSKNINPDIIIHKLPNNNLVNWWNKLYLFNNNDFDIEGRIIFSDLDNVIVGNMDDILQYTGQFAAINVLNGSRKNLNRTGSALMSWEAGKHNHIWDTFLQDRKNILSKYPGDQDWINIQEKNKQTWWQDIFPNQVKSYIFDCVHGLPDGARIVAYEGPTKIRETIQNGLKWGHWSRPPQDFIIKNWIDE